MYGHCPEIISAVQKQMESLDQIILVVTHTSAVELRSFKKAILPEKSKQIIFSDNGSTK